MTLSILIIEHERNAGASLLGERLTAHGARTTVAGPEAGRDIPESLADYDGLIVLGGSPGPLEDDAAPWLPRVRALMRDALDRELPLLGVCLGAQLLAVVAGGRVESARLPEVGVYGIDLTRSGEQDPLLGELAGPLRSLQWHFLEVTELPADAEHLASSPRCRNQAFRVGPAAWGLQFHLEAGGRNAEAWAAGSGDEIGRADTTAARVIAETRAEEPRLREVWSQVADRWLAIAANARAARAAGATP